MHMPDHRDDYYAVCSACTGTIARARILDGWRELDLTIVDMV
jgi:hypothetical protein